MERRETKVEMEEAKNWVENARKELEQSINTFCKEAHIGTASYRKIRRGEKVDILCCSRIYTYLMEFLPEEEYRIIYMDSIFYIISLSLKA